MTGAARARPLVLGGGDFVSFPFYGPWGSWYPWYTGFGWNLGYMAYNPWRFGATRWFWGPYGLWYDPFTYYWDPFWGTSSYSSGDYREPKIKSTSGSLRIKANLAAAKIYIDGALTGQVDEFDGLKDHLDLEGGRHTLEIRADGYETFKQEIDVKAGKTQTVRASLKEKK